MPEITCDICMDLIPLVQDGVASDDSRRAVEEHIRSCESCRALYGGNPPPCNDGAAVFAKLQHKLQLFCTMLMMFGIFFGLSLTGSSHIFYNCLVMPAIGALGYLIFQWRALYNVPLLLLIEHFITNYLGIIRGVEHLTLPTLLLWTGLYCLFAVLGTVIAGLLHFALHKEDKHETHAS